VTSAPGSGRDGALTPIAVAAFLRDHLGGDVSEPEAVTHGEWSKAFFYRRGSHEFVVRFTEFPDDFLKDQRVAALSSPRLPIPKVVEIGAAFDRFYAISERAHGDFMEQCDASAMQRVLPSLFELLEAEHEVDISQTGGFGLWRGSDGSAAYATWREALLAIATDPPSSRTHGWRERLAHFSDSMRAFECGYARIQKLVDACPNERHLLHSDLLNFNVLVQGDRVSAIFDWGASMYGDWLWDLAWITFWQPWYSAWAEVDVRGAALAHFSSRGLTGTRVEERLQCYELAIGLDGMAYQAFVGHVDNLAWTTRRVEALLRGN
jgi:hygromycin-B 4-O-kinase